MATAIEQPYGRKAADDAADTKYWRTYYVSLASETDGPAGALAAIGLPAVGDSHPDDAAAIVRVRNAEPLDGDPKVFKVTIQYSKPAQQGWVPDPIARPVEVSWDFLHSTEDANHEHSYDPIINGRRIENTAGELFDPPVVRDVNRPVLRMSRNEAQFNPIAAVGFMDTVNSDVWLGVPIGMAKLSDIRATRFIENNIWYWRVTYEFHFKWDGWQARILNQGFRHWHRSLADQTKVFAEITDENGQAYSEPTLLAADGTVLPEGAAPVWRPLDDPTTYPSGYFSIYRELPFASLNLVYPS